MKYVKKDNTTFIPFDGIEEVIDKLPPNIYTVESHPMRGMYLEVYSKNFVINEPKLYGEYPNKIDKIINGFSHVNRNMGVIMSGDKGLGKSLSAKILCNRFLAQGYPIILCDKYLDKLSSLLHSINQTCIVFFDEFDKIFTYQSEINNSKSDKPQEQFLSLFDGTDSNKKMFLITCNDIFRLNNFFINRPGRFHYNISFEYPTKEEVREYMQDNILKEYHNDIEEIVKFSERTSLNYDSLRAISFEVNLGVPFKEAIKDLNILNTEDNSYKITIHLTNGDSSYIYEDDIDFYSDDDDEKSFGAFYIRSVDAYIYVRLFLKDIKFNYIKSCYMADGKNCRIHYNSNDENDNSDLKNLQIHHVTFTRQQKKSSFHYIV